MTDVLEQIDKLPNNDSLEHWTWKASDSRVDYIATDALKSLAADYRRLEAENTVLQSAKTIRGDGWMIRYEEYNERDMFAADTGYYLSLDAWEGGQERFDTMADALEAFAALKQHEQEGE